MILQKISCISLIVFLLTFKVQAQSDPIVSDQSVLLENSKAIEMFDQMTNSKFFHSSLFNDDKTHRELYGMPADYVPEYDDEIIKQRLKVMDANSPIDFRFTPDVRAHIDFYLKRRNFVSRILGLSQLYFPLFKEVLDKYDLPLELKYVTIIESALNPVAKSHAGAGGLWQFMVRTGQIYDLDVSSFVDERFDPIKATEAAAQHFVDLYKIYGDWAMCLAAYNAGAGRVNRAIKASRNGTDFWSIQAFLPRETQRYVPSFIAAAYVFHHHAEHNIRPQIPTFFDADIDTITVRAELSFDVISNMLNIPMEELVFLNPSFRRQIIPASINQRYTIRLPRTRILDFVEKELDLYYMTYAARHPNIMIDYITSSGLSINPLITQKDILSPQTDNIVQNSENDSIKLETIETYSQLLNIIKTRVVAGNNNISNTRNTTAQRSENTHIVKRGDNLGAIARRYGTTVAELKRWNNISGSTIRPGQRLIVNRTSTNQKPSSNTSTNTNSVSSNSSNISESSSQNIVWHRVQPGDTLWAISNKYNTDINRIKSDNNLRSSKLKVGQRLKIVN